MISQLNDCEILAAMYMRVGDITCVCMPGTGVGCDIGLLGMWLLVIGILDVVVCGTRSTDADRSLSNRIRQVD